MGICWTGCSCRKEEEENDADILGVNSYIPGAPSTPMNERLFAEFDNPEETAVERNLRRESIQAVFSHLGADFSDIIQHDNDHRRHNPDSVSVSISTEHSTQNHHQHQHLHVADSSLNHLSTTKREPNDGHPIEAHHAIGNKQNSK